MSTVSSSAASSLDGSTQSEPLAARGLSLFLGIVLLAVLVLKHASILQSLRTDWESLAFWAVLILSLNLFPISVGESTFTLDMPLLLCVALLYPPDVAAFVALLGSLDVREIKGRVSVYRAFFNRAQVSLGVFGSGAVFHAFAPGLEPWTAAIIPTLSAVAVAHTANVLIVGIWVRLRQQISVGHAIRGLTVGRVDQFLGTYLSYCVLALVLARLYVDVGAWSVVAFLVPIAAAQQMLVRGLRLEALTERLRSRERLLERLFDRIVDERRDERLRVASDLHDDVLQNLTKTWIQGRSLQRHETSVGRPDLDVAELVRDANRAVVSLRRVISDLQKSPLGRGGLIPTLRSLAHDLQLDWRVPIHVEAPSQPEVAAETQVVAYQIAREAVLNALKHAGASEIYIRLSVSRDELAIEVSDDGKGFDRSKVDSDSHFGLGLMEERTRLLSGRLEVVSDPDAGTTVRASLPNRIVPYADSVALRGRYLEPASPASTEGKEQGEDFV
jgi:signal transduction histidine kinase